MTSLIQRLEALTGPSREVDAEIAKAMGWRNVFPWLEAPHFTGSIDAALTLVPDGDPWTLGQNIHHRYWLASINEFGPDQEIRSRGQGMHTTSAACALCIAALRARGVK